MPEWVRSGRVWGSWGRAITSPIVTVRVAPRGHAGAAAYGAALGARAWRQLLNAICNLAVSEYLWLTVNFRRFNM